MEEKIERPAACLVCVYVKAFRRNNAVGGETGSQGCRIQTNLTLKKKFRMFVCGDEWHQKMIINIFVNW